MTPQTDLVAIGTAGMCHILSLNFGNKNISLVIFPLSVFKEEHLSFTSDRMRTKYCIASGTVSSGLLTA